MAITVEAVSFLHWHRDGGLVGVMEFPAGTSRERIGVWRERVAGDGGAAVEVYNPAPPVSPERWEVLRGRMAAVRAARLAAG
ncbi:hypothetical protein [Streptomyces sp. NPDC093589]|uniref:hypothetical protein n=1 Tax=Streptomyces sp. NPDC093589 TaxID=3366043 RepID=UPI00381DC8FC